MDCADKLLLVLDSPSKEDNYVEILEVYPDSENCQIAKSLMAEEVEKEPILNVGITGTFSAMAPEKEWSDSIFRGTAPSGLGTPRPKGLAREIDDLMTATCKVNHSPILQLSCRRSLTHMGENTSNGDSSNMSYARPSRKRSLENGSGKENTKKKRRVSV